MLVIVTPLGPWGPAEDHCDKDYYVILYGKRDGPVSVVKDTCTMISEILMSNEVSNCESSALNAPASVRQTPTSLSNACHRTVSSISCHENL